LLLFVHVANGDPAAENVKAAHGKFMDAEAARDTVRATRKEMPLLDDVVNELESWNGENAESFCKQNRRAISAANQEMHRIVRELNAAGKVIAAGKASELQLYLSTMNTNCASLLKLSVEEAAKLAVDIGIFKEIAGRGSGPLRRSR
jgi:hypothetical protein